MSPAMPLPAYLTFMENLASLEGEDWFLQLPILWSEAAQASFGLTLRSAPDFASAVQVMLEFAPLRWPMVKLTLEKAPRSQALHLTPDVSIATSTWQSSIFIAALNIMTFAQSIVDEAASEITFAFSGPTPSYVAQLEAELGAIVTWNNPTTRFIFPNSLLSRKSPFADAATFSTSINALRSRAERSIKAQSLTNRVNQCLNQVTEGKMDAHETAIRLGLSRRSLERGLAAEGTSFSQLLDASLKTRLEAMLSGPRTSGEELAFKLGYSDSTSLYRAVRRLYGEPLSTLRARLNFHANLKGRA
ncbi:MAG: helix-turn-helix domain-containing protein [Sphingomonadaceae bacterium]